MWRQLRAWIPWLLLAAQSALAVRSWLHYRTWPQLTARRDHWAGTQFVGSEAPSSLPVAVIVPARDERANLLRLLPSLLCLKPPPAEILVVDDRSTDGTAEIAAGFGVRVVTASEPPPGWSGKNNACVFGAAQTQMP
ncbi:MAG: glycosyltransferase, partial [Chloroflexota bacterium]